MRRRHAGGEQPTQIPHSLRRVRNDRERGARWRRIRNDTRCAVSLERQREARGDVEMAAVESGPACAAIRYACIPGRGTAGRDRPDRRRGARTPGPSNIRTCRRLARPMPSSVNAGFMTFSRWHGLFIQAATTSAGLPLPRGEILADDPVVVAELACTVAERRAGDRVNVVEEVVTDHLARVLLGLLRQRIVSTRPGRFRRAPAQRSPAAAPRLPQTSSSTAALQPRNRAESASGDPLLVAPATAVPVPLTLAVGSASSAGSFALWRTDIGTGGSAAAVAQAAIRAGVKRPRIGRKAG